MPLRKQTVIIPFADVPGKGGLTKYIDIDDGGREVPVNMNFESEGFLVKDTGVDNFADVGASLIRRLWNFKQKNGTSFFLRLDGQKLRKYNSSTGNYEVMQTESAALTGTCATIAPATGTGTLTTVGTAVTGVGTSFNTELTANVSFITVGGIPRLVTAIADATHCTIETAFDTDITTASAFTYGTHIVTGTGTAFNTDLVVGQIIRVGTEAFWVRTITDATHIVVDHCPAATASGLSFYKNSEWLFNATAKLGFREYNNNLYFGNGVDPFAVFDGTKILFYKDLPRGNIYEVFKDAIHIAGVIREPLTAYYSSTGAPTTFPGANVYQPIGTDRINGLVTYYDALIVLKRNSLWKISKVYDPLAVTYLLQLDLINGNYGCCGIQAYGWVENDVWFFTGSEVRALGFKDQQFGVLGVNDSVLSNTIKETLKLINQNYLENVIVFYSNRRFYLSVPMGTSAFNNQIFVCHLLYSKNWTKIKNRIKGSVSDFVVVDGIIYSASGDVTGIIYKWSSNYNDAGAGYECYTIFRRYEDKDFSQRKIWRIFDLQFKNLEATCAVTIYADDFDIRTAKSKTFFVGTQVENEENPLGEIDWGEELWGDAFGESVATSNFINRKISFLSKSQSIALKVGNSVANETFSLAQFLLEGYIQPRKQFAATKITTIN
jgi:hypothetical protein